MHVLHIPSWYPKHKNDPNGGFFRDQASVVNCGDVRVGVIALMVRSWRTEWRLCNVPATRRFEVEDCGIPVYRVPVWNIAPHTGVLEARWICRKIRKTVKEYIGQYGLPDLVHVQSMLPAGEVALEVKERYNVPYIVTEHSTAYARGRVTPLRLQRAKRIAEHASLRIAVSRPFRDIVAVKTGAKRRDWVCVPNVLPTIFEDVVGGGEQDAKVDKQDFTFLTVGWLCKKKRHDLLLKAFARKYKHRKNFRLRICGCGPEEQTLKSLAISLGIKEQVEFRGHISRTDIITEYRNASVFVLPSDYETFGVVLIEALAMGLPLVATAAGGPEDIVNDSNGRLVRCGDIDEFAEAMEQVQRNIRRYPAAIIRGDCIARFGKDAFAGTMHRLYRAVLQNS